MAQVNRDKVHKDNEQTEELYAYVADSLAKKYNARHLGQGTNDRQWGIHILQELDSGCLMLIEVEAGYPESNVMDYQELRGHRTAPFGRVENRAKVTELYEDMVRRFKSKNIPADAKITKRNIDLVHKGIASDMSLTLFVSALIFKRKYEDFINACTTKLTYEPQAVTVVPNLGVLNSGYGEAFQSQPTERLSGYGNYALK